MPYWILTKQGRRWRHLPSCVFIKRSCISSILPVTQASKPDTRLLGPSLSLHCIQPVAQDPSAFWKNDYEVYSAPSNGSAKIFVVPVYPRSARASWLHPRALSRQFPCAWQNPYFVGGSVTRYFCTNARAPCDILTSLLQFSRTFVVPATVQTDALDLQLTGLESTFSGGVSKGTQGKASCSALVTDLLSWAKKRWLGTKQGSITGGFISSPKWSQRGNFPPSEPGWPNHFWPQQ